MNEIASGLEEQDKIIPGFPSLNLISEDNPIYKEKIMFYHKNMKHVN